jgi:hypothetical protein
MERLHSEESEFLDSSRAVREAFDEYETAIFGGDRLMARAALRRCCLEAPGQDYERMLSNLEERFPKPGSVEIRIDGERLLVVGASPAIIGRGDVHIKLRHAGISRRHAAVDLDDDGFHLRDAGSRNGTIYSGIPLNGRVPLKGSGTFSLGDHCKLQFAVHESFLQLEVLDGPDDGLKAVIFGESWTSPRQLFRFRFREGAAVVNGVGGSPLILNGNKTHEPIVLIEGDVVESPGLGHLEVLS